MFLSNWCSTSPPSFFKSKSKVGVRPYLAKEERQCICYVFRRGICISWRELSVRIQDLHRADMSTPVTRKGAVSVHTLLDIRGTDNLRKLQYVGLVSLGVCFSPFQLEMIWYFQSTNCFSVICGAVLLREGRHSAVTSALADFLHAFVNCSVCTSKAGVLSMCYSLACSLHTAG